MTKLLLIALGGAIGSVARYATGTLLLRLTERTLFPWGTLAVNLVGCFLIGYINGMLDDRLIRPEFRFLLVIGFLGGYTTFSSFGYETFAMLREGQMFRAGMNLVVSNIAGIALVLIGYKLSRMHA